MIIKMFSKAKIKRIFYCLILFMALFLIVLKSINNGYEEYEYEIDYSLLSNLIEYYDDISKSIYSFTKYQCKKTKVINSFFLQENSRAKENYALIYSLKDISTFHSMKKFVHNSKVQIAKAYMIMAKSDYSHNDARYFIILRRDNFWKKSKVFLFMDCYGTILEPIEII